MRMNNKSMRNIFLCVLGCIAFYWLLHETERVQSVWKFASGMLAPFVVGAALAFIFNVPMRGFENLLKRAKLKKFTRLIAILLTIAAIVLLISGVFMLLIPQIDKTIQELVERLPDFFKETERKIMTFLDAHPDMREWVEENIGIDKLNWKNVLQKIATKLGNSMEAIVNGTISAVGSVTGAIVNMVISIVFAFYCLASKETLARQGRKLIYAIAPEHFADETVRILRMTNTTFSNFITGQCLEAVILGLLFVVSMAIFRMPYIPLISVLITVTALVPVVGAFVGCVLGAFFILVSNPLQAVTFVIMFLVIQQFEGNVIYPRVVGSSIGLPGMWVLLAVAVGGGMFGVSGMFMIVPFASVLYALIAEFANKRIKAKNIDPEKVKEQPMVVRSHFMAKSQNAIKKRMAKKAVNDEQPEAQTEEQLQEQK